MLALRSRQVRNLLAINILALGTPMLLMGDEVRRSQRGNNNAYCQDNELSWFDWSAPARRPVAALRARAHPHPLPARIGAARAPSDAGRAAARRRCSCGVHLGVPDGAWDSLWPSPRRVSQATC
ncbi:MAG: hypothetical protein U1F25_16765 [Rubrivivax sp.]